MRKTPLGRLIVFEGPDGVGKSTLAKSLVDFLSQKGILCTLISFPGREAGSLGQLVYSLHHSPKTFGIEKVDPTSLQLLHVAAHIDAIESTILPALLSGRWIILDRYWWSTLVYGVVGGADLRTLRAMIRAESLHWGRIRPSIVFMVTRKGSPNGEPDTYRARIWNEYLKLGHRERRVCTIQLVQNDKTVDESLAEIARTLRKLLKPVERKMPERDSFLRSPTPSIIGHPCTFTQLSPAKPTIVYDTFWRFAAERQAIFYRRVAGQMPPWTRDPILREYKFTNVYRASDRVSQYLIKNVIYAGDQSPHELFFRIMLFKVFNRIETWHLLLRKLGTVSYTDYSFGRYDDILTKAMSNGDRIYSAAYIMPSGGAEFGKITKKHRMHLMLVQRMMRDELYLRIREATSMGKAFELLRQYPTIGDFLAYQYVIDLNYSNLINFSEMDFVMPGPGARGGIRKCFADLGGLNEVECIKVVTDRQEKEFQRLGLDFKPLWGRQLQLIDCQNLFCEVDKYARIRHPEFSAATTRARIKQKFRPSVGEIKYWFPPKWGLNELIETRSEHVQSL